MGTFRSYDAMPVYKSTLMFEGLLVTSGWSEVYYLDNGNLSLAQAAARLIAETRVQILSNSFVLKWIRTTTNIPTQPPPAAVRQRNAALERTDYRGAVVGNGDLPFVAAKIRLGSGDLAIFRPTLIRGLDDSYWEIDSDKKAKQKFDAWVVQYVNALKNAVAGIYHRVPDAPYVFTPILRGQYLSMAKRDTGRPFYLLRGRQ